MLCGCWLNSAIDFQSDFDDTMNFEFSRDSVPFSLKNHLNAHTEGSGGPPVCAFPIDLVVSRPDPDQDKRNGGCW
jgi:hypothetical protein